MAYLTVPDPKSDGHVVFLHPRQGFKLELSIPTDDLADWQVESFGPFLVLEKSITTKGVKIFWFQQVFDLKAWAKVSSVQIQEFLLTYKGNHRDEQRFKNKSIYVVLTGHNEEQRNTLTIVNPAVAKIKLAPHQLLEVVLFDPDVCDVHYECLIENIIRTDLPPLEMEIVGQKTVVHVLENGRYVDVNKDPYLINRHTLGLPVNPKIEEGSPIYPVKNLVNISKVYRAQHFFLQLDARCLKEVQRLPNGVFESGNLIFYTDKTHLQADYAIEVVINVKGSFKPKLRNFGLSRRQRLLVSENTIEGKDIGQKILAKEHIFDKNSLLGNPTNKDNVNFIEGEDNNLVIEIAPPHIFNSKIPKDCKWEAHVDPVWQFQHRHMPEMRLTIQPLDNRNTCGVLIQRFIVMPLKKCLIKSAQQLMFLGILKLTCEVKGIEIDPRCISFYLMPKIYKGNDDIKSSYMSFCKKQLPLTPLPPPKPTRVIIRFEEEKENTLKIFGGYSRKFREIKLEKSNYDNKKKNKK